MIAHLVRRCNRREGCVVERRQAATSCTCMQVSVSALIHAAYGNHPCFTAIISQPVMCIMVSGIRQKNKIIDEPQAGDLGRDEKAVRKKTLQVAVSVRCMQQ